MFNVRRKINIIFKNKVASRGLTLVELLVVVSIFTIITGISIFNYKNFNSYSSVQNLADDIALTIREAQGYAIGVRASDNIFNVGYGVHFSPNSNISSDYSGSNTTFILFADIDGDKMYDYNKTNGECGDPTEGNECIEILKVKGDESISNLYINDKDEYISNDEIIDIVFKRPNPEPVFCYRSDLSMCKTDISSVKIKVSSLEDPDNVYKIIRVSNVGQISVSNQ